MRLASDIPDANSATDCGASLISLTGFDESGRSRKLATGRVRLADFRSYLLFNFSDFVPIRVTGVLKFSELSRNESLNPAEYLSERPEMTSHGGKPRKAKTMEGNKTYENKVS